MKLPKWIYFLVGLVLCYFGSVVLIPLFASVFLAMLLEPFVGWLTERRLSRHSSTVIVVASFLILSAVVVWVLFLTVANLGGEIHDLENRLQGLASGLGQMTKRFTLSIPSMNSIYPMANDSSVQRVQIVEAYPAWTQYLLRGVGSIFEVGTIAIFVPLLLFYLLYDKDNLLESFNIIIGRYVYIPKLNSELPKMIRSFVFANLVTGVALTVGHSLGFFLLGFQNWLAVGTITGILNLVPLLGAPLGLVIALAFGVYSGTGAVFVLMVIALLACAHLMSNNWLLPQLLGSRINVNPGALIFGLLFWGWLWGAIGFLLGIPMTALIKILLESNPETYAVANLLAAKPRHIYRGFSTLETEAGPP